MVARKKRVSTMMLTLLYFAGLGANAQNLLKNPESVVYDAARDRYLVSNTGDGKIIAISSAGQQSIYASDQTSIRGLQIYSDKLYAAANAGVIEYDLATGVKKRTMTIAGQGFLNDITVDSAGYLYITDTMDGKVYKLDPVTQSSSTFVGGLASPNGILFDAAKNRLLVCFYRANSPISAIRPADAVVSTVVNTSFNQLDGLTEDNQGRFYVSSAGNHSIYRYDAEFSQTPELVSSGHNAPADIYYNKLKNVLAVPNFDGNTVDFIPFEAPPVIKNLQVTNTRDSGPGSLRQAILDAMVKSDLDTITFNIPTSDSAYSAAQGVWTIRPRSLLPELNKGPVLIDGFSQAANQGNTNPDGLEIVINGSLITGNCFVLSSSKNTIKGLVINGFNGAAILISGENTETNHILQNFLGSDADGMSDVGNLTGVEIKWGASHNYIGNKGFGNIISGNDYAGVLIMSPITKANRVFGNIIGLGKNGKKAIPNTYAGVMLLDGSYDNIIGDQETGEGNVISATSSSYAPSYYGCGILIKNGKNNRIFANLIGLTITGNEVLANGLHGICIVEGDDNVIGQNVTGQRNIISGNNGAGIFMRHSTGNIISGNYIGADQNGTLPCGNSESGIHLDSGSSRNLIGPGNIIAFNGGDGVRVQHDSSLCNTISENSISQNAGKGIHNLEGGNRALTPPTLTEVTPTKVSGTTLPSSIVEIFSDTEDEGKIFQYRITSRNTGAFTYGRSLFGPKVTATVTDSAGNTSEFSNSLPTKVHPSESPVPAFQWQLQQNYPNPFNQGTVISFRLETPEDVVLKIFNVAGEEIVTLIDAAVTAGRHTIHWPGLDNRGIRAPSGVYLYRLKVGARSEVKKLLLTR